MKRPTFYEGVGVALIVSVATGILFPVLVTLFSEIFVLRSLIAGVGLAYLLYLLKRSDERVGRITTLVVWWIVTTLIWSLGLSLPLYLLAQLGLIWLTRSLYYYSSLLAALADLGLVLFGAAAATWAWLTTHSPWTTLWCFFLVQALFVFIPSRIDGRWTKSKPEMGQDRFQRAYRVAETALTKLSNTR
jgi:hypothetical protein